MSLKAYHMPTHCTAVYNAMRQDFTTGEKQLIFFPSLDKGKAGSTAAQWLVLCPTARRSLDQDLPGAGKLCLCTDAEFVCSLQVTPQSRYSGFLPYSLHPTIQRHARKSGCSKLFVGVSMNGCLSLYVNPVMGLAAVTRKRMSSFR